jgi:Holliday junction resolvasome RuvABC endonuclease subunit
MKYSSTKTLRVLAVDPSTEVFGFAVLEGQEQLVDFGLKKIRQGRDKNTECLRRISAMIDRYQPDIVVVEDYQAKGCRRRLRIRVLLRDIVLLASEAKIKPRKISRLSVQKAFAPSGALTRHQIATEIGKRFAELVPYAPGVRKPWMSQDERMSIFDAVAFALVFLYSQRK